MEAKKLVQETLDDLDTERIPVSLAVQKCTRVARLINDYKGFVRLRLETVFHSNTEELRKLKIDFLSNSTLKEPQQEWKQIIEDYISNRKAHYLDQSKEEQLIGASVADIVFCKRKIHSFAIKNT
ncbi:hypothetical protein ACKXGF_11125 [Alkalibacillus sp. S2W]|uniref:hypothetical protein n=1 Tax=Alkalibacillus sp. S2W TaxID=3386553 RepID=UPI00398D61DB